MLEEVGTDLNLGECNVEFAKGRGRITMEEVTYTLNLRYQEMAKEQDCICWRQFMEGMISRKIQSIQATFRLVSGSAITAEQ